MSHLLSPLPRLPEAFFHQPSGSVRFWVLVQADQVVGASVRSEVLHFRFHPHQTDDDPLATYQKHAPEIAEAVRRRVALGSIEPVMLREVDLPLMPVLDGLKD